MSAASLLAQLPRPLDGLAPEGVPSLPVIAVRPATLAAALAALPAPQAAFARAAGFTARAGTVLPLPGEGGLAGALFGLGEAEGPAPFGALPTLLPAEPAWHLAGEVPPEAMLHVLLGAYRFTALRTEPARPRARFAATLTAETACVAELTWLARDLINLPANLLGPAELADLAARLLADAGAAVDVIRGPALAAAYPLVAAVGAGSTRPPAVVRATWSPPDGADAPLVSLCGKGVCFDTGGLDLKPPAAMLRMRKDMAGAAVSLALALAVIRLRLPLRLEIRLGCVENAVSADAMRPSDIVQSRKGLTVEIGNTDAEGRLVLADLLAEASERAPALMLDFATLTGAARVALGPDLPAMFCNDDALAEAIARAGAAAADPVWRLPLWPGYSAWLESGSADLTNISEKSHAGAVVAALFLQRFVTAGLKWAHFDIYGWNETTRPGRPEGGEAQGFRLGLALLRSFF